MIKIIKKIKEKIIHKINNKYRKRNQRKFIWIFVVISILNFLILVGFIVYLYFWIKARS